jgi:hypothetical protein
MDITQLLATARPKLVADLLLSFKLQLPELFLVILEKSGIIWKMQHLDSSVQEDLLQ